jgi:hypothetical protein
MVEHITDLTSVTENSEAVRCPSCRYALISPAAAAKFPDPDCPHCRSCLRRMLVGWLIPVAIFVVGVPFESRYNPTFASLVLPTIACRLYDYALFGMVAVDIVYGLWLVWYSSGLRWCALLFATLQFLACCVIVYVDCLWANGPP